MDKSRQQLRRLLANRDALTTAGLVLGAIAAASGVIWIMSRVVGFDENGALGLALSGAAQSPWALLVAIVVFTAGSFIGAPQFLLIALSVAAFGPLKGFVFAYLSTLISASLNFLLARYAGTQWLRKRQGPTLKALVEAIGRNGFLSAMMVRIVPSAPFVVVNMALGLTTTPYAAFLAGTAIGIIPKTAMIALLGKVVERARAGDLDAIGYLILAAGAWVGLALLTRWILQRRARNAAAS